MSLPEVFIKPAPVWSAYRSTMHYGYGMLTANATHLHYEYRLEKDNSVEDDFWIIKSKQ
jgi:hypothetical protein